MRSGSLGEVRRSGPAFTAEVRGLAHYLQQPKGRLYQYGCDADLGDARCGIDLDDPDLPRHRHRDRAPSSPRLFTASGLGSLRRRLVHARPRHLHLRRQRRPRPGSEAPRLAGSEATIELWQPMAHAIAPGDTFTVTAGCDKQFATCQAKFANAVNFRGFPHMPGNDFILAVARPGDPANDGQSRS